MAKRYSFVASVPSSFNPRKTHDVKMDERGMLTCDCPIWIFNKRGNRTCKHTDFVLQSGFLNGTAKLLIVKGGRWDRNAMTPIVCKNYPNQCDDCEIRFKCYTEQEPELNREEYKQMKVNTE
jgi:hypothetical protein